MVDCLIDWLIDWLIVQAYRGKGELGCQAKGTWRWLIDWLIDWLIVAVHRGQGEPGCKVKGIGNEWLIDWLSRYTEDRESWAAKLREPEDGCATCGFWRDSLQDCEQCNEVNNFSKYSK